MGPKQKVWFPHPGLYICCVSNASRYISVYDCVWFCWFFCLSFFQFSSGLGMFHLSRLRFTLFQTSCLVLLQYSVCAKDDVHLPAVRSKRAERVTTVLRSITVPTNNKWKKTDNTTRGDTSQIRHWQQKKWLERKQNRGVTPPPLLSLSLHSVNHFIHLLLLPLVQKCRFPPFKASGRARRGKQAAMMRREEEVKGRVMWL